MVLDVMNSFDHLSFARSKKRRLFSDRDLRQIAKETQFTEEKVSRIIARHLLIHLIPMGSTDCRIGSTYLQNTILQLTALYRAISQAHFLKCDLESLPEVRSYLQGYTPSDATRKIIAFELRSSFFADPLIRSFPALHEMKSLDGIKNDYETTLFDIFNQPDNTYDTINMAEFFYKHIAFYKQGVWCTWAQAAKLWARKRGSISRVRNITDSLPRHWIYPIRGDGRRRNASFKKYVYNKTLHAYMKALGIKIRNNPIKTQLLKHFENPDLRMDIVYFSGKVDGPQRLDASKALPDSHLVKLGLYFREISENCCVPAEWKTPLFSWLYKNTSPRVVLKKRDLSCHFQFVEEQTKRQIGDAVDWEKDALTTLASIANKPVQELFLERFFERVKSPGKSPLIEILRKQEIDERHVDCAASLIEILQEQEDERRQEAERRGDGAASRFVVTDELAIGTLQNVLLGIHQVPQDPECPLRTHLVREYFHPDILESTEEFQIEEDWWIKGEWSACSDQKSDFNMCFRFAPSIGGQEVHKTIPFNAKLPTDTNFYSYMKEKASGHADASLDDRWESYDTAVEDFIDDLKTVFIDTIIDFLKQKMHEKGPATSTS